jgi:hypothetical protein
MIRNHLEENLTNLPLSKNCEELILADFIKTDTELINQELYDYYNFSLYSGLLLENFDSLNFNDKFQVLKLYISINSSYPSLFFHSTILKHLDLIIKHLDEPEYFFRSKDNLVTLRNLLEFFPILKSIVTKFTITEEVSECLDAMGYINEKVSEYNDTLNQFNKEEIKFYLKLNSRNKIKNVNFIKKINNNIPELKDVSSSPKLTPSISEPVEKPPVLTIIKEQNSIGNIDISHDDVPVRKASYPKEYSSTKDKSLSAKTKKYNMNHFERESFVDKYLNSLNVKESTIHNMLTKVASSNYENKRKNYEEIIEYLDFPNFKRIINDKFKNHSVYLIGSCRTGLLMDIKDRRTSVDLLLLPDVYQNPKINPKWALTEFMKTFNTIEGIMNILHSLNTVKDSPFVFMNLEKVSDSDLQKFFCNFDIMNKKFPDRPTLNVNFIIYNEKLKLSSDILAKFFYKNPTLQSLHMFFQEILITKLKLISRRRDLSNMIIAFLDSREKVFAYTPKHKNCFSLSFKEPAVINTPHIKKAHLAPSNIHAYNFDFNENIMKDIMNGNKCKNLGELILEFMRYFINYLEYIKNDYNRYNNKNFLSCKGFDILEKQFKHHLYGDKSQFYILDHEFLKEFYNYPKRIYDNDFCKKIDYLEELYFKLCENAEKITNYSQIIDNISEVCYYKNSE